MTDLVPQEAWDAIGSRTYRGFYRGDSMHEMITNAVRDAAPFVHAAALEEAAEVWQAYADDADKRAGRAVALSRDNWAGRAVAYGKVAGDLRTRASELRGTTKEETDNAGLLHVPVPDSSDDPYADTSFEPTRETF